MEAHEEFFVGEGFLAPVFFVDGLSLVELDRAEVFQPFEIEIFEERHPAEGTFFGADAVMAAVHDPFEDAHILAETGPEEVAVFVFTEPIDVEDAGEMFDFLPHIEPVPEVIAHVIAAEGEHGQIGRAHV